MKPLIYLMLFSYGILGALQAQELKANVRLLDQSVLEGYFLPRKVGTTQLQFRMEEENSVRSISTANIDKIIFDLEAFKPMNLLIQYKAANYKNVVQGLKGKVIPYFSFVDIDANSNELVKLFIQSLYRTGNHPGVHAAGNEIAKYDQNGEMRRIADIYQALSYLEKEDLKGYEEYETYFREISHEDPLAPALWMGQAKFENLRGREDLVLPQLAKIIVEAPMETEWSAEALYMSAQHQQTHTNLVVAYQICQEIQIVAPLTHWPAEAEKLQAQIKTQAAELNISLVEFGEFRKVEREDDPEIDYRERQRALKEQENEQELQFTE